MTPLGIACGVIGGWIILAAMGATIPHRFKRATQAVDPGEDDSTWLDDVPIERLSGVELDRRFYDLMVQEYYL